jgi:hypothetical protein
MTPEHAELLHRAVERRLLEMRYRHYAGLMKGEITSEERWASIERSPEDWARRDEQVQLHRISQLEQIDRRLASRRAEIFKGWFGSHAPEEDRLAHMPQEAYHQARCGKQGAESFRPSAFFRPDPLSAEQAG